MTDPTSLGAPAAGDVAARPQFIAVRWTLHAHGFRPGEEILVDPAATGIAELLTSQILVPLPANRQPQRNVG